MSDPTAAEDKHFSLTVAVRLRTDTSAQQPSSPPPVIRFVDGATIAVRLPEHLVEEFPYQDKDLKFDHVFPTAATQGDVYRTALQASVQRCLTGGENVVVMAYGESRTGKLSSLFDLGGDRGLLGQAVEELLASGTVDVSLTAFACSDTEFFDLLRQKARLETSKKKDVIQFLSIAEASITSLADVDKRIRSVQESAATLAFCHFVVRLAVTDKGGERTRYMSFVFLFHSERPSLLNEESEKKVTAVHKSLAAIGETVNGLFNHRLRPPFIRSILTMALKTQLVDQSCNLLFLVHSFVHENHLEESICSLNYADRLTQVTKLGMAPFGRDIKIETFIALKEQRRIEGEILIAKHALGYEPFLDGVSATEEGFDKRVEEIIRKQQRLKELRDEKDRAQMEQLAHERAERELGEQIEKWEDAIGMFERETQSFKTKLREMQAQHKGTMDLYDSRLQQLTQEVDQLTGRQHSSSEALQRARTDESDLNREIVLLEKQANATDEERAAAREDLRRERQSIRQERAVKEHDLVQLRDRRQRTMNESNRAVNQSASQVEELAATSSTASTDPELLSMYLLDPVGPISDTLALGVEAFTSDVDVVVDQLQAHAETLDGHADRISERTERVEREVSEMRDFLRAHTVRGTGTASGRYAPVHGGGGNRNSVSSSASGSSSTAGGGYDGNSNSGGGLSSSLSSSSTSGSYGGGGGGGVMAPGSPSTPGAIMDEDEAAAAFQMHQAILEKELLFRKLTEDVLLYLQNGCRMTKYREAKSPHPRYFCLSADRRSLVWFPMTSDDASGTPIRSTLRQRELSLADVQHFWLGQSTTAFRARTAAAPSVFYRSFSLIYDHGRRSLDVVAESSNDFEAWLFGLACLLPVEPQFYSRLDVSQDPSLSDLDPDEQALCSAIHVNPTKYLHVRTLILEEYVLRGYMTLYDFRASSQMDILRSSKMLELFEAKNWIRPPPPLPQMSPDVDTSFGNRERRSSFNTQPLKGGSPVVPTGKHATGGSGSGSGSGSGGPGGPGTPGSVSSPSFRHTNSSASLSNSVNSMNLSSGGVGNGAAAPNNMSTPNSRWSMSSSSSSGVASSVSSMPGNSGAAFNPGTPGTPTMGIGGVGEDD